MSVIKAGETGPILNRLSTVDLTDHLAQAHAVIEEAKRRAARIVSGAETRARQLLAGTRRSGYQDGYEKGYAEGTAAGHKDAHEESIKRFEQEHAVIVEDMQAAVANIQKIKEDLTIAARKDLLDFAMLIARKLTFAIGRSQPESVRENLDRALRLVGSNTDLTIRVHPHDVTLMRKYAPSVLRQLDATPTVNIVADDSFAPGGCIVESGRTRVDATLETQVDEIVTLMSGRNATDENGVEAADTTSRDRKGAGTDRYRDRKGAAGAMGKRQLARERVDRHGQRTSGVTQCRVGTPDLQVCRDRNGAANKDGTSDA